MSFSNSEARVRLALLALLTVPGWACATAINGAPSDSSPLGVSGASGSAEAGSSASAGSNAGDGQGGAPAAAGSGASGATQSAGAAGSGSAGKGGSAGAGSAGAAGKAGSGSAGSGSAGAPSAGAANGGSSAGGAASSGGTSAGGASAGGASAGTSSGGASEGGAGSGATCDATHATVTFNHQETKTIQANDCVRLVVNPSWGATTVKLQPLPETAVYPVPFSFVSCGGNGTGTLTANFAEFVFNSSGCDFFVQFAGGATQVKVAYFD